jgi:hypothetical protein
MEWGLWIQMVLELEPPLTLCVAMGEICLVLSVLTCKMELIILALLIILA